MSLRKTVLLSAVALSAMASPTMASATTYRSASGGSHPASPANANATTDIAPGIAADDIVVTARRTSERLQDVPVAVTAVTEQKLADLAVRDIAEISKVSPGLNISSQGSAGRAKFAIRGQTEADSRLNTDGSVGIYIDGVNIPRTYGIRSSFVDIAQIEVLKGPQGTLYGKNTTGGALNITTQKPSFELGGYIDLTLGNYDNRQLLGALNLPLISDTVAARIVLQRIKRDGFGSDAAGNPIADDNVFSGRAQLLAKPSDNLTILISGDFTRQRNNAIDSLPSVDNFLVAGNGPTRALGQIARQLGLNPNSATDRLAAYAAIKPEIDAFLSGRKVFDTFGSRRAPDNVNVRGGALTIDYELNDDIVFKSITSYRYFNEKRTSASPFSFNILTSFSTSEGRNFSQELQLSSIDGVGLDWQIGGFYNRETGNEWQAADINPLVNLATISAVADGDIKNSSLAGYVQATYNVSSKLRLTGGFRMTTDRRGIDYHNRTDPAFATVPLPPGTAGRCSLLLPALGGPTFPNCNYEVGKRFNAATYLLSVDYRPTRDMMIYASHSKGYRAGGFTSQAPAAPVTSVAALDAAFAPYDPETVFNYEAGLKSDWFDRRLRVNLAGYYQDYKNIQQQIRDLVNGTVVTLIRNAAKGTIYGGELEITAKPFNGLELNGGVSYVHARYKNFRAVDSAGNSLDLSSRPFPVPAWQYNLGAAYSLQLEGGSIRASANYSWQAAQSFRPDAVLQDSVSQKAYGLLDGRIAWEITSAKLELSVFGKNLTNKRYAISATNLESIGYNNVFPGNPRLYGIQVRKSF